MKTTSLWLCLSLLAAGEGPRNYMLKDRTILRAQILKVEDEKVNLRIHVAGGAVWATRQLSDFAPQSAFRILRSVTGPKDISGHIRLAEFAVEHGLIAAARRELRKVRGLARDQTIEPDLEQRLVAKAIAIMEDLLQTMIKSGKIAEARYVLTQIMQSDPARLSDEQKASFIDLVEKKAGARNQEKERVKQAAENAAITQRREKLLEPVRGRLDRGKKARRQALLGSTRFSSALRTFDRAVRYFESVQRTAEDLRKKNPNDAFLIEELGELSEQARDYTVSCLLDQASLNLTRGQFTTAMGKVNRVLVMDENNAQAISMRARIEIAANQGWRY